MDVPDFIRPQLATLVSSIPKKGTWSFEIKYDGYRILAIINNQKITLKTRNNHDWSKKFPLLIKALKKLPCKNAIIDGEIVVLDRKGISNFQLLQNAIQMGDSSEITYYAFDLLYYNNKSLTDLPLKERRKVLKQCLKKANKKSLVQFSKNLTGNIPQNFKRLCHHGYEGVIAKNQDSIYQSRRTRDWLKLKCMCEQEFVIGGYTDPVGSRDYFGALLLGYYTKNRELIYCGKVGTGFNAYTLRKTFALLQTYVQKSSPFVISPTAANVHWVKPMLVAEIVFKEWTEDGFLRQPVFQGLRFDKPAKTIRKETTHEAKHKKLSSIPY